MLWFCLKWWNGFISIFTRKSFLIYFVKYGALLEVWPLVATSLAYYWSSSFFFFLGLKLSSEAGTLLSDMVFFFFFNTDIIVDSMAQPYEASDESDSPQIKSASWLLPQL